MSKKILYIDDEIYGTSFYIEILQENGYDVVYISNPEEALKISKEYEFDIIVTDIMMPPGRFPQSETRGGYRTGVYLINELRKYLDKTTLIGITSNINDELIEWFSRNKYILIDKRNTNAPDFLNIINSVDNRKKKNPKIFIVHGRDEQSKNELKEYIKKNLKLGEPLILSDLPSKGKTIIEKFEYYAKNIDIVFVLMTPDDYGYLKTDKKSISTRPRLNVIFEYGYFLGSIKRHFNKVFILKKGNIELPSDISGIIYIDITNGIKSANKEIRNELKGIL
jgi:predicted nucleotide-binding protein